MRQLTRLAFAFALCALPSAAEATSTSLLGPNLAKGRSVTYSAQSSSQPATRAVDGNTNPDRTGNSIAIIKPNSAKKTWLQIDLGSVRHVYAIEIHNSHESCANFGGSCSMGNITALASESTIVDNDANPALTRATVTMVQAGLGNGSTSPSVLLLPVNRDARYVRLWQDTPTLELHIAEIKVFEALHWGKGRPVAQSSTSGSAAASRAADGNASTSSSSNSIAQTTSMVQPYWEVDTQLLQPMRQIEIYPRSDSYTFPAAKLMISDKPMLGRSYAELAANPFVEKIDLPSGNAKKTIDLNGFRTRHVRVQVPSTSKTTLALAEVAIWAFNQGGVYAERTKQSNTPAGSEKTSNSDRGVDGDARGKANVGTLVRTDVSPPGRPQPWWQVDLGGIREIETLRLWNRLDDCCRAKLTGIWVFTSDRVEFTDADTPQSLKMQNIPHLFIPASTLETNYLAIPILGRYRYLRVQKELNEPLEFAEAEIIAQDYWLTKPENGREFVTPMADALAGRDTLRDPLVTEFEGYVPFVRRADFLSFEVNDCTPFATSLRGPCTETDADDQHNWREFGGVNVFSAAPELTPYSPYPMFKFTQFMALESGGSPVHWLQGGAIGIRGRVKLGGLTPSTQVRVVDTDNSPSYWGWGRAEIVSDAPSPAELVAEGSFMDERPDYLNRGKQTPGPVQPPPPAQRIRHSYYASLAALGHDYPNLTEFEKAFFVGNPTTVNVKYYNKGDLGIGRDMTCAKKPDGTVACAVGNYQKGVPDAPPATGLVPDFGNVFEGLNGLLNGGSPFATVCMVSRGGVPMSDPNKVFFWVYGPTGDEQDKEVRLDRKGHNQTVPGNCITCHGGELQTGPSFPITKARFLPFDFTAFDFDPVHFPNHKRDAALEEGMRKLNSLVLDTVNNSSDPPNPNGDPIEELIDGWYANDVNVVGRTQYDHFTPFEWNRTVRERQFYKKVIRQVCRSCHVAQSRVPQFNFRKPEDMTGVFGPIILGDVCKNHEMPNAERTASDMWHRSVRSQLLSFYGIKTEQCQPLKH